MIWESQPWKREVARRAAALERRKTQRSMREASLAAIEQDVFLAAYAVRRLVEANKISDEIESVALRAQAFSSRGEPVDHMNWHKLDRLYDLTASTDVDVSLRDWCNQIIHSFVFMVDTEGSSLTGFFVASDRFKDKRLLRFSVDVTIELLRRVAGDQIVNAAWERNANGEMRNVFKSNRPRDPQ